METRSTEQGVQLLPNTKVEQYLKLYKLGRLAAEMGFSTLEVDADVVGSDITPILDAFKEASIGSGELIVPTVTVRDLQAAQEPYSLSYETRRIKDYPHPQHDAGLFYKEMEMLDHEKKEFLIKTKAVPAPMQLYALWLSEYLLAGENNRITHYRDRNYYDSSRRSSKKNKVSIEEAVNKAAVCSIDADGNPAISPIPFEDTIPNDDYYKQDVIWLPKKGFKDIPPGYGAGSMDILVIPELIDGECGFDLNKAKYGHNRIYVLEVDKRGSKKSIDASTNDNIYIETFPNVDAFMNSGQLAAVKRLFLELF